MLKLVAGEKSKIRICKTLTFVIVQENIVFTNRRKCLAFTERMLQIILERT